MTERSTQSHEGSQSTLAFKAQTTSEREYPIIRNPFLTLPSMNEVKRGQSFSVQMAGSELALVDNVQEQNTLTESFSLNGKTDLMEKCSLDRRLPSLLIFHIMGYLDFVSIMNFRLVSRSFNDTFFAHCTHFLPKIMNQVSISELEPVTRVGTTLEVLQNRKSVIDCREREWSKYLLRYTTNQLLDLETSNELEKKRGEVVGLRWRLKWVHDSYRRAAEEILNHLARSRHVRHNVRRNLFNYSTLGFLNGISVFPVLLPDGTLCVSDLPDSIRFFQRRPWGFWSWQNCCSNSPSKEKEHTQWIEVYEKKFEDYLTHMFYVSATDTLHVGLANGEIVMLRLHSDYSKNLEKRLAQGVEHESPPPLQTSHECHSFCPSTCPRVEEMGRYIVAQNYFGNFSIWSQDAVDLVDYEWSEAAIMTRVARRGGDGSHVVVAKHERDITAAVLAFHSTKEKVALTKEDVLVLAGMQRLAADFKHKDPFPVPDLNEEDEEGEWIRGNRGQSNTLFTSMAGSDSGTPNVVENEANIVMELELDTMNTTQMGTSTRERRSSVMDEENTGNTLASQPPLWFNNKNPIAASAENATTPVNIKQRKRMAEKHVFGVLNERTSLMAASARTHELALFVTNLYMCETLGVNVSGYVKQAFILLAPAFKRINANVMDDMKDECEFAEEAEVIIAGVSRQSIILVRQVIRRTLREMVSCVWEKKSKIAHVHRHRTWYHLRGYVYHVESMDMLSFTECVANPPSFFVSPRPSLLPYEASSKKDVLGTSEKNSADDSHTLPQYSPVHANIRKEGRWHPWRDGHPYFNNPFFLYSVRGVPCLAYLRKPSNGSFDGNQRGRFGLASFAFMFADTMPRVTAAAVSPSHAFFILGMEQGSILLVSPRLEEEEETAFSKGGNLPLTNSFSQSSDEHFTNIEIYFRPQIFDIENNGTVEVRETEERSGTTYAASNEYAEENGNEDYAEMDAVEGDDGSQNESEEEEDNRRRHGDEGGNGNTGNQTRTFTYVREMLFRMLEVGQGLSTERARPAPASRRNTQEITEDHSRENVSRFYRTTTLPEERPIDSTENERWERMDLLSLSAKTIFGTGFLKDTYINQLQSSFTSVFAEVANGKPYPGGAKKGPFHAVWILPPRENEKNFKGSGIMTMHLDEWKLTSMSFHHEITIFDLSLSSANVSKNNWCGRAFTPLLTMSPYLSSPWLGVPGKIEEPFLCALIRQLLCNRQYRMGFEEKLLWQRGVLVVHTRFVGTKCSIYDFDHNFRDPIAECAKNSVPVKNAEMFQGKSNSSMPLSYSARMSAFWEETTVPMPGYWGEWKPRHYPLYFRRDVLLELTSIIHPFTATCAAAVLLLLMLRLDDYVDIQLWHILPLYAVIPATFLLNEALQYDRYAFRTSGVPYALRILSIVLGFIVFPVLFVAKKDWGENFHPSWLLVSIPLISSIALAAIRLMTFIGGRERRIVQIFGSLYLSDCFFHLCCITTVVLVSIYFDGPSSSDPAMPRFHIAILIIPMCLVFGMLIGVVRKMRYLVIEVCFPTFFVTILILITPIIAFLLTFHDYYNWLENPFTVERCSVLPAFSIMAVGFIVIAFFLLLRFATVYVK